MFTAVVTKTKAHPPARSSSSRFGPISSAAAMCGTTIGTETRPGRAGCSSGSCRSRTGSSQAVISLIRSAARIQHGRRTPATSSSSSVAKKIMFSAPGVGAEDRNQQQRRQRQPRQAGSSTAKTSQAAARQGAAHRRQAHRRTPPARPLGRPPAAASPAAPRASSAGSAGDFRRVVTAAPRRTAHVIVVGADEARRDARDDAVVRHRTRHHGPGADDAIVADATPGRMIAPVPMKQLLPMLMRPKRCRPCVLRQVAEHPGRRHRA